MSGFNNHIISILKNNLLYHGEAFGVILGRDSNNNVLELNIKHRLKAYTHVFFAASSQWDWIMIPEGSASPSSIVTALSRMSPTGILIIDITKDDLAYFPTKEVVKTLVKLTKVFYDDKVYLVVHKGDDYGN